MSKPTPEVLYAIDEQCDAFESALVRGAQPEIRKVLDQWTGHGRAELFQHLLALEVDYRQRRGEVIDPNEYRQKYGPEFHACIDEVLPSEPIAAPTVRVEAGQTRVGGFTLIEKLGEGGMGSVWLALQEVPVRRRVALKLIRSGIGNREVLARFAAERHALALMDHPNIARIIDAGETENGQPWFAMELVQGMPLNEYCDRNSLSIADRLKLFMDVCSGVQHAHQKGLIHRDLKPSNILVAECEGKAVPKVIDFGLAKAFAESGAGPLQTMHTEYGQVLGTIRYMSPEQAGLNPNDVDTRSDIYALGVILYELLTGLAPFESPDGPASLFRMLEQIRTREPVKPSSQLSTRRNEMATIVENRQMDPRSLGQELAGDLDWIVMKALEKERHRRYQTAADFSADIQRYLDQLPVLARPPSTGYLLRRFVKRHRGAVAAAAAILITLLAGLGFSIAMYAREKTARSQADRSAVKSRQVATILSDMLSSAGPSKARGRDATMLREILDATAARISSELNDMPDVKADLCMILGETYEDLSDYEQAEEMLRLALELRSGFLPQDDPLVLATMFQLASTLDYRDKLGEAESLTRKCLDRLADSEPMDPELHFCVLDLLAWLRFRQGDLTESENFSRLALAQARARGPAGEENAAQAMSTLGTTIEKKGRFAEASKLQREALALRRKLLGEVHPGVVVGMNNLGHVLLKEGKLDEVMSLANQALELEARLLGKPVGDCTDALHKCIAMVHAWRGEFPKAIEHLQLAIACATEIFGADHRFTNDKRALLIRVLVQAGNLEEAAQALEEAESVGQGQSADTSLAAAAALLKLAQHEIESAEHYAQTDIDRARAESRDPTVGLAEALRVMAAVRAAQGRWGDAERLLRESLAILRPHDNPASPLVAEANSDLARILRRIDPQSTEAAELESRVHSRQEADNPEVPSPKTDLDVQEKP